ncbi:hypothetical protein V6N12_047377 [Hibiscus sabdariffa]|uniref:Uncharacterized protein n=1 Tax=Hibiscus sabdariffa TaxID=183260 RepID=A0ABR2DAP4_9ROSI
MFAVHLQSSSCGLHEVPITSGDGPLFITGFSNNELGTCSSVVPTQEESISNASRLQEVPIEIVEEKLSTQVPRARAPEAKVTGLARSKRGINLVLRAGIDKCNWWMDLPKRKGKSKVLSRGAKTKKNEALLPIMVFHDSSPLSANLQSPMSHSGDGHQTEAENILKTSKNLRGFFPHLTKWS